MKYLILPIRDRKLPKRFANCELQTANLNPAPLHFKKRFALSIAEVLETSTFYHIFTSFHSGWGVQYFK